ncbi:unnamed protein product [Prunus armeniaca]
MKLSSWLPEVESMSLLILGNGKLSFRHALLKVGVVHAHSPLALVFLCYHDNVGQPFRAARSLSILASMMETRLGARLRLFCANKGVGWTSATRSKGEVERASVLARLT